MVPQEIQRFVLEDGTLDYGALMRYWRKQVMGWKNAAILAEVYNTVLIEEHLTAREIQRMEQQNKVPTDQKRRQLLATILNIPPAYFGLTALASYGLAGDDVPKSAPSAQPLDLSEYSKRLKYLWARHAHNDIQSIFTELLVKIQTLQDAVLYGSSGQRAQLTYLLCHYLLFYGNVCREQNYSDTAITFLDKAVKLADEHGYADLGAKAMHLRGDAYCNKWLLRVDRATERTDLQQAINSFQAALQLVEEHQKRNAPNGSLKAAIVSDLGVTQAYNAQSAQEKKAALHIIDKGGSLITSQNFRRDPTFLEVTERWYHINKAQAYITFKHSLDAIDELGSIHRRYVYIDIVEANAYLTAGRMDIGVFYLENALHILQNEQLSSIYVALISNLYQELCQNKKYMTSPEVARLGGKLLKIQHPSLFD